MHDVAKPVQMKMQVGELHGLVDERKAPVGERLSRAHEGKQHPYGEIVVGNDLPRREIHDRTICRPEITPWPAVMPIERFPAPNEAFITGSA